MSHYKYIKSYRIKLKAMAVELHGGKCCVCGYEKCLRSLQFHHVDPESKNFSLSNYTQLNRHTFLFESTKCVLVCANCHGEIEGGLIECPQLDVELAAKIDALGLEGKRKKKLYSKECVWCGTCFETFARKQKFCKEPCSHMYKRKVKAPCLNTVRREAAEIGFEAVGRKYGVTGNAVRKWLKRDES